ncbi:MAG: CotH kinase family protein [Bacteroidia bacterium]
MTHCLRVFLGILLFSFTTAQAQNLTLPTYRIEISPAFLDSLYTYPKADIYYPATFHYENITYPCQVKFKGATSLNYPKKSWAVRFNDNLNIFKAERINLNADFKDYSFMRNFLVLSYFRSQGIICPQINNISLKINDRYAGVFTHVEHVDEDFLANNGREDIDMYKAENHGAGMFALVKDEQYPAVWEERAGADRHKDMKQYFNKLAYFTRADFDSNINNIAHINNHLTYFAVHFVLCSFDNFTKNQFLNKNSITGKYELIPWDNEGSFGNLAWGEFDSSFIQYNMKDAYTAEYNVVFQRLLENPTHRATFIEKMNSFLNDGFAYFDTLIDNQYNRIKNDVYQDTTKDCSNAEFDAQMGKLKFYMSARKQFLQSNPIPQRNPITDFYFSNPFPTPTDPLVTVRVRSTVVQDVNLFYADSVSFDIFGRPFIFRRVQLFDDGQHNDIAAGDLIYGNTINTSVFKSKLVPFALTGAEQNYPPNGIYYVDYYRSKTYAFNVGNTDNDLGSRVRFGKVYKQGSATFIEVINTSATLPADISYCHIRGAKYYEDIMFRHNVVLAPLDTILVTNDLPLARKIFPDKRISKEEMYFNLALMDPLILLSPVLTPITNKTITFVDTISQPPILPVVINEINYNSHIAFNTGDWVELYNPNAQAITLTNWMLRDADPDHLYSIPAGTVIQPNAYVVLCEDTNAFKAQHPEVTNIIGNIGYSLANSGEMLRLYNTYGYTVDSVKYDDKLPWPEKADGRGPTLELINYTWDNALPQNWYAFSGAFGTPGARNHIVNVSASNVMASNNRLLLYPNPGNGLVKVRLEHTQEAEVEVFNQLGQLVVRQQVVAEELLDLRGQTPGIYYVKATTVNCSATQKLIIR